MLDLFRRFAAASCSASMASAAKILLFADCHPKQEFRHLASRALCGPNCEKIACRIGGVKHIHVSIKEQRRRNPARLRVGRLRNAAVHLVMKVTGDVHIEIGEQEVEVALGAAMSGDALGRVYEDATTVYKAVFAGGADGESEVMIEGGGEQNMRK